MTESDRLSGREREVWTHLVDGEQEQAARLFARLEKEEQKGLVRKLDQADREALRAGFEAAIDRDTVEGKDQRQGQSQGRDEGQSRDEGQGRARGGTGRGGRSRGGRSR